MRIDTGQHMRMDQRMKLAPRMIQSMEILQMPMAALEERVEQELASNPTLELQEATDAELDIQAELKQDARDAGEGERELVVSSNGDGAADDFERLTNISDEYGEDWKANTSESLDDTPRRRVSESGERDRKLDAMANTAARGASLYEQLMDQWRLVQAWPEVAEAGEYLIGFIDADGYLRTPMDELLKQAPRGMDEAALRKALALIQRQLEPAGIGARSLQECLLLQIDAALRIEPDVDLSIARMLVADHLRDIETNRLPKIAKATGLSIDEINQAIRSLRQFHPHPGRQLAEEPPHTITPDAVIEYDEEQDRYVAFLTNERIPSLQISQEYLDIAASRATERRTRDFLGGQIRSARWLLDAISQRQATLLRVINVVLEAQRDFFDQGPQALRPLPMTLVADQLGIHVATVSRAVNEKYLQTPRGIVPLRMFFSGGTETESGEAMSWQAVQAKLEEVIAAEDKNDPLSDDALAEELKKHGIDIARRTVAKYRKQLGIASARQRKQY